MWRAEFSSRDSRGFCHESRAALLFAKEKMDSKKLEELRQFSAAKMSEKWLPQCILFMKDLIWSSGKVNWAPRRCDVLKSMRVAACVMLPCHAPCPCGQDIPKGSTGKPARIGLAKRMKLEALDVNKSQAMR